MESGASAMSIGDRRGTSSEVARAGRKCLTCPATRMPIHEHGGSVHATGETEQPRPSDVRLMAGQASAYLTLLGRVSNPRRQILIANTRCARVKK